MQTLVIQELFDFLQNSLIRISDMKLYQLKIFFNELTYFSVLFSTVINKRNSNFWVCSSCFFCSSRALRKQLRNVQNQFKPCKLIIAQIFFSVRDFHRTNHKSWYIFQQHFKFLQVLGSVYIMPFSRTVRFILHHKKDSP